MITQVTALKNNDILNIATMKKKIASQNIEYLNSNLIRLMRSMKILDKTA